MTPITHGMKNFEVTAQNQVHVCETPNMQQLSEKNAAGIHAGHLAKAEG